MAHLPRTTPIIVGVGEVKNKSLHVNDAIEPAELMVSAIRKSFKDTGANENDVRSAIDGLLVVPPWTWPYVDLPGVISKKLGFSPRHSQLGVHGGHQPNEWCDEAARRVSAEESKAVIITGGLLHHVFAACGKAGKIPPPGWAEPDPEKQPIRVGDLSAREQNIGTKHSIGLPIHIYPMYENSLRAYTRQSFEKNTFESSQLYEAFDKVSSQKDYSWRSGEVPRDAREIGTVTKKNRMICSPYLLLMNAFNAVNLAAACLITSVEQAEKLGIPEEKWVYILGGAATHEREHFWERSNFHSSPAMEQALDAALEVSGVTKDEIDAFDIYSKVQSVQLVTFGFDGNDPTDKKWHIPERARPGKRRRAFSSTRRMSSSQPRKGKDVYPKKNPLPGIAIGEAWGTPFEEVAQGAAFIETYTVEYSRDGQPSIGLIVGRLKNSGHRFLANHGDELTLQKLADPTWEPIYQQGRVSGTGDGRNLFFLSAESKI
uniref:Thiolase-like protein type 1 additional C-terminal domain-containing protein n=1 Tax=Bionectria ochroleuca TaxID=29856 RepID=A0A8H7N836_BIOOC